ncbi:RDD family protein [Dokdonella sp.]|uniref:RDD family protein n=1 Tax=Dokdonella sp. TaxID=2291710 RepID=UPI002623C856|nr:RDD family protein [Dokdonella sp.]
MRCPDCGWTNPAGFTHCHGCRKPLASPNPRAAVVGASHASGDVLAGEGARLVATLVDLCLLAALLPLVLYGGLYLSQGFGLGGLALFGLLAALAVFAILGTALLDSFTRGSLGKRLVGVRVVDANGDAPGLGRSTLRTIAKYALHPLLSLPVLLAERLVFGRHSLHNLLTGCHVVSAKAPPEAIRYRLSHDAGRTRFRTLARLVGIALVAAVSLLGALLGYAVLTAEPNPRRDAARDAIAATNEAARRIGAAWEATGEFPAQWNDAIPSALGSLQVDAASGTVTATANDPSIAGAHFVLVPEVVSKKGKSRIGNWRCTSPDLPASDLPFRCRSTQAKAAD